MPVRDFCVGDLALRYSREKKKEDRTGYNTAIRDNQSLKPEVHEALICPAGRCVSDRPLERRRAVRTFHQCRIRRLRFPLSRNNSHEIFTSHNYKYK